MHMWPLYLTFVTDDVKKCYLAKVLMFKLLDILLAMPVGTASAERSFSQMKLIKSRLALVTLI